MNVLIGKWLLNKKTATVSSGLKSFNYRTVKKEVDWYWILVTGWLGQLVFGFGFDRFSWIWIVGFSDLDRLVLLLWILDGLISLSINFWYKH